ncbi:MAG: pentapeptide repeat-containing protein [Gammaproteobacteria bacterium]
MDHLTLKDVTFLNCRFHDTVMRNAEVESLFFENVDFRDMTLEDADAFAALASTNMGESNRGAE